MRLDIPVMSELCKKMATKEVISATIGQNNTAEPDPEGLASYEIFGKPGTEDRELFFGHINLNSKFIHPQVLAALKGLKRETYKDLIAGNAQFYIQNGELKGLKPGENPPASMPTGTGLLFLYNNWDKLNFKPKANDAPGTKDRKEMINLLKRDEVFLDKWLVIPAFYRDVDLHTNKRNRWNTYYVKLIQMSSMIKASSAMMGMYDTTDTHVKIQSTLEEMHREIIQFIGGTKGYIHQHVMGKPTKYSCRLVISSANFDADREDQLDISFTKSSMPLHAINKIFSPFMSYGLKYLVNHLLAGRRWFLIPNEKGEFERKELDPNYEEIFSTKSLRKRFDLYEESKMHRLEPFTLRFKDGKEYPIFNILVNENNEVVINTREELMSIMEDEEKKAKLSYIPLTWCHILYMTAYNMVKDKVIYITRYPIEDYNNIYPSEMSITPCTNTQKIKFNGVVYPKFPILPEISKIHLKDIDKLEHLFVDTLNIHSAYLKALNADFDGDMVSVIPMFTNEANESAIKYIRSITNMGAIDGGNTRPVTAINIQTIYNITR